MNLSKLLLIHAFISLAAGIVLIVAPELIPSTVNIEMQAQHYLLSYFLGSAEISLAVLSFYGRKLPQFQSLRLIVNTLVVFHLLTAGVEIYDFLKGGSEKLWINVCLRLIISFLLLFYLRRQKTRSA